MAPGRRFTIDWINFEFYEGKKEGRKDEVNKIGSAVVNVLDDTETRAKMKDLLSLAPAMRMNYSIMGGRRSHHYFTCTKLWQEFEDRRNRERKMEEVMSASLLRDCLRIRVVENDHDSCERLKVQ